MNLSASFCVTPLSCLVWKDQSFEQQNRNMAMVAVSVSWFHTHHFLNLSSNSNYAVAPWKPLVAVLSSRSNKMGVPFELKEGQSRIFHELPSGLNMEVIVQKKNVVVEEEEECHSPPLVFVHGSYHAAWCWAEHWLPFFSASGFDCYALSLLGQVHPLSLSLIHPTFKFCSFTWCVSSKEKNQKKNNEYLMVVLVLKFPMRWLN